MAAAIRSGDVKIDDSRWRKLLAGVKGMDRAHVRVGILASKGGRSRHSDSSPLSLVDIAFIHEYGSGPIPERSFIRSTFTNAPWLASFTAALAKKVVTDGMSLRQALSILGERSVAEVRRTVTEGAGVPPPLKPATIARKGSDRPLVDTGRLMNALSYEVVIGDAP